MVATAERVTNGDRLGTRSRLGNANLGNPSTIEGSDIKDPLDWGGGTRKRDNTMVSQKALRGMAFAIFLCSAAGLAAVTIYEVLLILSHQPERLVVRIGLVLAFTLFGAGVVFARALSSAKNELPQHS